MENIGVAPAVCYLSQRGYAVCCVYVFWSVFVFLSVCFTVCQWDYAKSTESLYTELSGEMEPEKDPDHFEAFCMCLSFLKSGYSVWKFGLFGLGAAQVPF